MTPGAPPLPLLDPAALARVQRLELLARRPMSGAVSGRHRSPARGVSVEFAEHRAYVPGDDVRDLDWKVYAKSDRYYLKQYVEETNLRATIVLDASGSMSYRGTRAARLGGHPLSKLEYGRYLAASLMHLLIGQQDAVGLVTFDAAIRDYLPARGRAGHLRVLLEALERTAAGGETGLPPVLHAVAERIPRRGLVILVSDLFSAAPEILRALHHFRFRKHEVVVLHVMAEEELTFPFEAWSRFDDLEAADRRIEVDPRALRAAYLEEVRAFRAQLRDGCGRMQIDYEPLSTAQAFDVALAAYLARRR